MNLPDPPAVFHTASEGGNGLREMCSSLQVVLIIEIPVYCMYTGSPLYRLMLSVCS